MKSNIFTINARDFSLGLIVAVLAAVLTTIAQMAGVPGFSFSGIDWTQIVSVACTAGASYLVKNYLSDKGSFLGITQ